MRIFVLILLTGFLALAVVPRAGLAMAMWNGDGIAHHVHDCPDCIDDAAAHSGEQGNPLDCHHVNACAAAMLPQADGPMLGLRAIRDDYPLPGSEIGAAIALSCDLPPPRA
ncbi:MAG: hypothetical protein GYB50_14330 [Rhodobacteraceae bacterium]|nr:hypothetical protein [Paracoccaceae bacterium]